MQTKTRWTEFNTPGHSCHAARIQAVAILQRNVGITGTPTQSLAASIAARLAKQPWPVPRMNRYQPGQQLRGGELFHLILDCRAGVIVGASFKDQAKRDAYMAQLNVKEGMR